jgi:2-keto-3-deoxy-L-rhamnonate aldolase RhmA
MADQAKVRAFTDKLKRGDLLLGSICATMSPAAAEVLGYAGSDFVLIDTELLLINPETVENMVRATECAGAIPIIKVRDNNPIMIEDAFVSGAPGVMVPHVRSAEDLRRACDASYFPPRGKRGLCVVSRSNLYGQGKMADLIAWTNQEAIVIPIIEDVEAIERIDEIMAYPGVDLYELGPADLSNSYGLPPDRGLSNPPVAAALERMLESARKFGKHIVTVPNFGRDAPSSWTREKLVDRGVRVILFRPDSVMLGQAMQQALTLRQPAAGAKGS